MRWTIFRSNRQAMADASNIKERGKGRIQEEPFLDVCTMLLGGLGFPRVQFDTIIVTDPIECNTYPQSHLGPG